MPPPREFTFERSRGVVWVCDVAGSSARLNSNDGAQDTEAFLPRLYWIAALVVESAGGKFIKWTGDGFLAWFETPLHRNLQQKVGECLRAVWQLTVIVNVTQLGVKPKRNFKIRHGLTYEQDALLTRITDSNGFESLDLLGRSVVLAFRLSGITANFPSITAQGEIAEAARDLQGVTFQKWRPSIEESLRFFKGEKWGTTSLYRSIDRKPRVSSKQALLKRAKKAVKDAEGKTELTGAALAFTLSLYEGLRAGPEWADEVSKTYVDFLENGLLENLKSAIFILEESRTKK